MCLHVLFRKLEAGIRHRPGSHSRSRRGLLLSLELIGLAVLASHVALVNPSLCLLSARITSGFNNCSVDFTWVLGI